jgi:hypothetical protein
MIAVVGSQSTGKKLLIQVKALSSKASLGKNSFPKAKESLPEGQSKSNSAKSKEKSSTLSSLIKKASIITTWTSSENSSTLKHKKLVDRTKASAAYL